MPSENKSLEHLLWIDLPDDMDTSLGDFTLNPSIPLPFEPEGKEDANIDDVTWDKVIAAALLVLANSPSHEYADYYRSFLNALRPNLFGELNEAYKEKINEKDWNTAEDIVLALRGLKPASTKPRHALAKLYAAKAISERKKGDKVAAESYENAAEAAFGELLAGGKPPEDAWFDAGIFRYNRGDFLRASETLDFFLKTAEKGKKRSKAEELVRLCHDGGQASEIYREAYAALSANQIEKGLAAARIFKDAHPSGWTGSFLLGWALRLSENWQESRECLEEARNKGCKDSKLYHELAICARALGDFAASADALEEALRQDPEDLMIITNMAIVKIEQGKRKEAERWVQTALTLEPDNPICLALLKKIETVNKPPAACS